MITGDAMGKPLVEALDDPGADYDVSSLFAVVSSAALFSAPVKDEFFKHLPNILITDAVGSSETGSNGMTIVGKDNTAMRSGPTVTPLGNTVVFDEELHLVAPGSGVIGKIARGGDVPIGYYNDPTKSAEVFITVEGRRYAMPGDFATIEADGSITLLGRGSVCINSGGEKIYPEEVEEAIKRDPAVADCVAVGVPDDRWGEAVTAVVAAEPGEIVDPERLKSAGEALARFKRPRHVVVVDEIRRGPNGKVDYGWARSTAAARVAESA
jgi:acyl-CoA synthetase (AMP-forming)/AMP-acid ligase II